jgi:hypothetical protein
MTEAASHNVLLRLPRPIAEAYRKWAQSEHRSNSGQIRHVLIEALSQQSTHSAN